MKPLFALKDRKTGKLRSEPYGGYVPIYTKRSLALINTWDFPECDVVKVKITEA